MNRLPVRGGDGRIVLKMAWLLFGIVVGGTAVPAQASPIRGHRTLAQAGTDDRMEAYFRNALKNQWRHVIVPKSLRSLSARDGLLPDMAFVDYLRWRRTLSPARFDFNHPRIGPMLVMDQLIRTRLHHPPDIPHPPKIDGDQIEPPHHPPPGDGPRVPEPSTAAMALTMIGAVAVWRRREARGS